MDSEREAHATAASTSSRVDPLVDVFDAIAGKPLDPPLRLVVPWPIFSVEPYCLEIVKEIIPLLFLHWKEISADLDILLKPVWSDYEKASAAGVLRIYTIRENGKLVGYSIFSVRPNSHYGESIQANNDIIWLAPELRGKLIGYKFIRWCDRQLRIVDKVQKVRHHVKLKHNWGPLLERQGYVAEEVVYTKRLDLDPDLNPRDIGGAEPGGDA